MEPNVSVIVTVFKRTEYLKTALESVLAQTYESYEIIVSDDANSPETRSICQSVSRPEKVRYRSNQSQLGVALNVRAAVAEARGSYIAILNDDDYWEPNFLARLVPPLDANPALVLAFSGHQVMCEDGKIDSRKTYRNSRVFRRSTLSEGEIRNTAAVTLQKTVPMVQAAIFRRQALPLEQLSTSVAGAYDFWVACLLATTGHPFYYVAERLTRYRVHGQMETLRPTANKFEPEIHIYRTLLDEGYFPEFRGLLERQLSYMLYRSGRARLDFHHP